MPSTALDRFSSALGDGRGARDNTARDGQPNRPEMTAGDPHCFWPALDRALGRHLDAWEAKHGVVAAPELEDGRWEGNPDTDFAVYNVWTEYDPGQPGRGNVDPHAVRISARGELTRETLR